MNCCVCENETQSIHSPCVVQDDELLIYALMDPRNAYVETNGKISFKKLNSSNLKKTELSISRKSFGSGIYTYDNIVTRQLQSGSSVYCHGFVEVVCLEIRNILIADTGLRAFCVKDDGLPDFVCHAAIGYAEHENIPDTHWRATARGNLLLKLESLERRQTWDW